MKKAPTFSCIIDWKAIKITDNIEIRESLSTAHHVSQFHAVQQIVPALKQALGNSNNLIRHI